MKEKEKKNDGKKDNQENQNGKKSNSEKNLDKNKNNFDNDSKSEKLSKQEIDRILEALSREEKRVQEKMKKVKLTNKNKKQKFEKDW